MVGVEGERKEEQDPSGQEYGEFSGQGDFCRRRIHGEPAVAQPAEELDFADFVIVSYCEAEGGGGSVPA